jgi:methionyl aminopeptidase
MGLPPYPAVVCTSVNDVIVHGIPNRERLRDGDIVGLDFGSILDGFVGDAAITVPVGEVDAGDRSASHGDAGVPGTGHRGDASRQAPGRHRSRSAGARGVAGFHVIRTFVGHGIGRRMHEEPQVYNYGTRGRGLELKEGMVLAIEPMVCVIGDRLESRIRKAGNGGMIQDVRTDEDGWTARTLDGTMAAHFENSIAITANGPRVLGRQAA